MQFHTITFLTLLVATASAAPTPEEGMDLISLANRQTSNPCSQWTPQTRLVGDGSPKKWWLWKQVTGEIRCGDTDTCAISAGEYESWTIGATLGGGKGWISGGFSVEKSWETGTSWTCEDKKGSKICLWIKIAHTEYEVQDGSFNSCGGWIGGKKRRITSPNKNNKGGYHQCSVSDCREEGAQYWVDS